MKLRPAVVIAAASALVVGTMTGAAQAAPANNAAAQSAEALAANAAAALVATQPAALHASADDSFKARPAVKSGNLTYVAYDRTYKGLPVYGGDFVVATNSAGQVLTTSVAQDTAINLPSVTPSITAQKAQDVARTQLSNVDGVGPATLITYALGTPRLAWESTVSGRDAEGQAKLSVIVDAATGKVLHTQEKILHGDATSGWNGPSPLHIDTTQSGSTFSLKDPTKTNVSCQDAANNQTFSGPDDQWGNGNPTSRETACADALFAVQTENKMLSQWLGRNGADGNGGGWPIRVGLNDLNAFYDGTQVQIGHNQQNQWISSIDVVAHEHGHGIDDHTPGGISGSGTQEFVADVFGTSAEVFANEPAQFDGPDFLIGERINLVGSGPIRNMYNPSALGHKNCYDSSIPSTEVHAAAGPGNHWYYLLAEGTNPTDGQPTSTTCNNTTITGIGVEKALKIFYNAMLIKTTGSSYLRYRTWTLTAAKNLFPGSCAEFNTVKAAWDAVSVPAQSGDPTCTPSGGQVTVTNPGNQSSTVGTPVSLTLQATGGTAPYTWTASGLPAGLSASSGGVISGTPTTQGTSNVTVTATDSSNPAKSGTASFSWTVSPTGGGCSGQKLLNPGFESGNNGQWTTTSGVVDNSSGQAAHSGSWKAWLDGYGSTHTDSAAQSVAIPAGCHATLTFWLHIDSAETTTSVQYDKLTVTAGSTTLATYSNLNKAAGYSQKTFDVSSLAGQTVSIKFNGTEDSSLQTSFVVDDTALTLS